MKRETRTVKQTRRMGSAGCRMESTCGARIGAVMAVGNGHTAVKLILQELEAAAGAEGWVDVCKEPDSD